jgi:hypothetical protein
MLVLLTEGFIMYAAEMASCGMIYIPSFMKIDRDVQVIFLKWLDILFF